jgi:hypothetical protein
MKTTIDMAREVYGAHTIWSGAPLDRLEQLVALVRADEREACAKIVETPISGEQDDITMHAKDRVAAAIRARWNT